MTLKPTTYSEAKERANRQAERRRAKIALLPPSERYSSLSSKSKLGKPQSPKNRNSSLSSGKSRKGLGAGRRMKEWRSVWRWLKPRFEAALRTECEFDFIPHNCFGPLDPAHSKKRNKMQGNDIYAVAIACRNIHQVLDEKYTHKAMYDAVMMAIERSGGLILP